MRAQPDFVGGLRVRIVEFGTYAAATETGLELATYGSQFRCRRALVKDR